MTLYLPHCYNILAPVEPLTRYLHPRQLAHWRRDAATWKDTGRPALPLPRPLERLLCAMRAPVRMLIMLKASATVVTWSSYINGGGGVPFPPVGWWSMRATSGTNEANRGSAGAAADMTILSATLGQVGKLGANEAALMDGANSRYQTPNNAALAALTTWEWVFLVNPTNAGEGNFGALFSWGNGPNTSEPEMSFNGATRPLAPRVFNTTPTQFLTTTTTVLAQNTWQLVFCAYDDGGDRKLHVYIGVSGGVSEASYSAQPAMTGTYKAPTNPLNLFNRTSQTTTFAGPADEALAANGNLTTATTRTQLTLLSGA